MTAIQIWPGKVFSAAVVLPEHYIDVGKGRTRRWSPADQPCARHEREMQVPVQEQQRKAGQCEVASTLRTLGGDWAGQVQDNTHHSSPNPMLQGRKRSQNTVLSLWTFMFMYVHDRLSNILLDQIKRNTQKTCPVSICTRLPQDFFRFTRKFENSLH